jgi:ACS family tartrate transporter-like MFS transporter
VGAAPRDIAARDIAASARAALAKARIRLLPFLCLLYLANYLDRINVSFASLQMNHDLGFTPVMFGLGAGFFFVGYVVCEIPSNLILERLGARRWIARIMISWGVISASMMYTQGAKSFYVLRLVLGAAEAGFFPGIILYLTYWFPQQERARATALFLTANALANVIAGPACGAILGMHGALGLSGWQWLFLLEGIPSVILGSVVLYYLPDGPAEATWLSERERDSLVALLRGDQERNALSQRFGLGEALRSARVWILTASYVLMVFALYGVSFWLPRIIKEFGVFTTLELGFLAAVPYLCGAAALVLVGISSDRRGERRWHLALPSFAGALGLALAARARTPVASLSAFSLGVAGVWGMIGPFWSMPPEFLRGTAAAGGIALINSIGHVGGFAGPALMGYLKQSTDSFESGLDILGAALAGAGIIVLLFYRGEKSRPSRG